jgi:hypothetical protein
MTTVSAVISTATVVLFWGGLLGLIIYFSRRGKLTTVTLLPYQRGVLFKWGKPARDVGPGKYRVWAGSELLVHGDVRPISVNYENLVVALDEGFSAVYGFSASVNVRDMRKAIYSARDYTQVPPAVLLRCARRRLHVTPASSLKMNQAAVAGQISEDAKVKLERTGFELISFRLTQLALAGPHSASSQTTPRLTPSNR